MRSGLFTGTPIYDKQHKLVSKNNYNYLVGVNLNLSDLDLSDLDLSGTPENPLDLSIMNLSNCDLSNVNLDNTIIPNTDTKIELTFSELLK